MSANGLPQEFQQLEPFVAEWALDTAFKRDAKRGSAPVAARQEFYDAVTPVITDILDHLDQTPLALHDDKQRNLMQMALTYAHIAQSIEVQGPAEDRHTRSRKRIPIISVPADH